MRTLMNTMKRFRRDEEGVTLVEYGIALVLAITVGVTALGLLGGEVVTQMNEAQTIMQ